MSTTIHSELVALVDCQSQIDALELAFEPPFQGSQFFVMFPWPPVALSELPAARAGASSIFNARRQYRECSHLPIFF